MLRASLVALAAAAAVPAAAAPDGACSVLDIPQCIGWVVECPSHAPDWALTFDRVGVVLAWKAGPAYDTLEERREGVRAEAFQRGGLAVTAFTTDSGVAGEITARANPDCSDGHFFDHAPFSVEITRGLSDTTLATGQTGCCVFRPDR
ncbi:hypothetical protein DXV76_08675 [Rhodobacteraceae bacterium CCMM004]|nr:hypothetical protein DXV76_08675 [Rhodobacteraceae bacterium CCMM004]